MRSHQIRTWVTWGATLALYGVAVYVVLGDTRRRVLRAAVTQHAERVIKPVQSAVSRIGEPEWITELRNHYNIGADG